MKPDTFNVPAYKFALVTPHNECNVTKMEEFDASIKWDIGIGTAKFIPWENFDGLTIGETCQLLGLQTPQFAFACYKECNKIRIISYFSILFEKDSNFLDSRLDKIIEQDLMAKYSSQDEKTQKVIRCFFERYQDKTHEDTVKRIRELNPNNQN